jgi:tRNA-specific adenosine deaminase 1
MDPTPTILCHFDTLKYAPPKDRFTVMAAFFLVDQNDGNQENCMKIIAMATGTKCLAKKNYSRIGDAVHDFHAEVLARRSAVRWILQEMAKETSEWLDAIVDENGHRQSWSLRQGVSLNMYISELPCKLSFFSTFELTIHAGGEASTRAIAHLQTIYDPEMALLKSQGTSRNPESGPQQSHDLLVRGREGYGLLNRVRTKPG